MSSTDFFDRTQSMFVVPAAFSPRESGEGT